MLYRASPHKVSTCVDHLQKLCKQKALAEAISYAALAFKQGFTLPHSAILSLLQECTRSKDPSTCRQAHSLILHNQPLHHTHIMEELVLMLSSCGCLQEAQQAFSELLHPSSSAWNAIISACASSGQCERALAYLYAMQHMDVEPNKITFANMLKACSSTQSFQLGSLVHEEIVRMSLESNTKLGNMTINMYIRCQSIEDACRVFERLPNPDVVSWGTMMMGYAVHGHGTCALMLFENMQSKGLVPNTVVLLGLLKACLSLGGLVKACQAHDQVVRCGFESDVMLGSTLVDMYSKLGSLEEGHLLFKQLHDGNIITWGSLIAGYVQHGNGFAALELFEQMKQEGVIPDKFIFSCVFKACNQMSSVAHGKCIHIQIMYCRVKQDVVVGNSLIDMYAKCGELEAANKVFDEMLTRNVVSWGALIAGYVQHDHSQIALELHDKMQQEGLKPDMLTATCLLKACGAMGALQYGRLIHEHVVRKGCSADIISGNVLVDMYAKCGSLEDAEKVFDGLHNPDLVSWDAIIAGLVQHGKSTYALKMFSRMQEQGIKPDEITFLSILKACGSVLAIQQGKLLHNQIVIKGYKSNAIVGNALIDMYIKCGSLEEARRVFDELPKRVGASWGAMIAGYAQHEYISSALELLNEMHTEFVGTDSSTYLCILKACGKMRALKAGRQMHDKVIICRLDVDLAISNSLIDMYARCGSLKEGHKVFDALSNRNVVTWDTLITGYVQHGYGLSALQLWGKMCEEGVKPIKVTFLCILKACCSIGAIEQGRLLHHYIVRSGFETDLAISNTVIDMYAKCGSLEDANESFDNLKSPDLVSWTANIEGKTRYGNYISARQGLEDLRMQGLKPNEEIFMSLLGACRQAGLVKDGRNCFQAMTKEHGLVPSLEHCSCMIDLLGNAGCLKEATNFIWAMPCEPDAVVWTSLLASSKFHGNVELGNFCLDKLVELSQHDASVHVLVSKAADMIKNSAELEEVRKASGAQEKPEMAWIENGGKVHEFSVRSGSSGQEDEAFVKVKGLLLSVREDEYMPYVDSVMDPTFLGTEQNIILGGSYAKLAGVLQQQPVRDDNFMHCMAICVC